MIDEMECPYCNSENIELVCNVTEVLGSGVNEAEGTFLYHCVDCDCKFYIYEKTQAIERRVEKIPDIY